MPRENEKVLHLVATPNRAAGRINYAKARRRRRETSSGGGGVDCWLGVMASRAQGAARRMKNRGNDVDLSDKRYTGLANTQLSSPSQGRELSYQSLVTLGDMGPACFHPIGFRSFHFGDLSFSAPVNRSCVRHRHLELLFSWQNISPTRHAIEAPRRPLRSRSVHIIGSFIASRHMTDHVGLISDRIQSRRRMGLTGLLLRSSPTRAKRANKSSFKAVAMLSWWLLG